MTDRIVVIGDSSVRGRFVECALGELAEGWRWTNFADNTSRLTDTQRDLLASDPDSLDDDSYGRRDDLICDALDGCLYYIYQESCWQLIRNDEGDILAYDATYVEWLENHAHHVCPDCFSELMTGETNDPDGSWDQAECRRFEGLYDIITDVPEEFRDMADDLTDKEFSRDACDVCGTQYHGERRTLIAHNLYD